MPDVNSQEVPAASTATIGLARGRGMQTLVSIQYLRATAAIMVVYYHIFSNRVAEHWAAGRNIGLSGVDIFFIISGFIMWTSTSQQRGGQFAFLKRRVFRVYPMWWMALTIWILMRFVIPDRLHNADVTASSVICSYLLFPHFHNVFMGRVWPILVPGWTLQLEIFFYAVFSLTLLVKGRAARLGATISILCVLAAVGSLFAAHSAVIKAYTNPLLLEFAAGIFLSPFLPHLQRLSPWLGLALMVFGLALLIINYQLIVEEGFNRVLILGIPACLIVAGALVLEPILDRKPNSILLLFGDASYSLYLTHPIAISIAAVIWEKLHLPVGAGVATIAFIPFALAAALIFAVLVYHHVEQPLLRKLLASHRNGPKLAAALLNEGGLAGDAPALVLPSDTPA